MMEDRAVKLLLLPELRELAYLQAEGGNARDVFVSESL
jgi:hypothetical protein